MKPEEAQKMLDGVLAQLSEHFDAVQILATWPAPNGATAGLSRGVGNWYARQGIARQFIEQDAADTLTRVLAPAVKPTEEDGA